MLLLIDAGNTRIKWALAADSAPAGQWLASGAVSHADSTDLAAHWREATIDAVLVSNVAGPAMHAALMAQLAALPARAARSPSIVWFASAATLAGVINGYRSPASLGCDRFAALVGAWTLRPGRASIVATCGTATTIDALDAAGHFIGGMILPGLGLMAASLAQRAAQLAHTATPARPAAGARPLFADNTQDAIHSGCLAAQAGAIERAVTAHGGAQCLLSGGAAAWVAPYLPPAVTVTQVENLVLLGLHAAALAAPVATSAIPTSTATTGAGRPC